MYAAINANTLAAITATGVVRRLQSFGTNSAQVMHTRVDASAIQMNFDTIDSAVALFDRLAFLHMRTKSNVGLGCRTG